MIKRRSLLTGLAGILAAGAAPAFAASYRPEGRVLMPVKKVWQPPQWVFDRPLPVANGNIVNATLSLDIGDFKHYRHAESFIFTETDTVIGFNMVDGSMELVTEKAARRDGTNRYETDGFDKSLQRILIAKGKTA